MEFCLKTDNNKAYFNILNGCRIRCETFNVREMGCIGISSQSSPVDYNDIQGSCGICHFHLLPKSKIL